MGRQLERGDNPVSGTVNITGNQHNWDQKQHTCTKHQHWHMKLDENQMRP